MELMRLGEGSSAFTRSKGFILGVSRMLDVRTVSPPGIALVAAFALIYTGISMNRPEMVVAGWLFVGVAVFLQLAYLVLRNWNPGLRSERGPGSLRRALFQLLVADFPKFTDAQDVPVEILFDSD